MTGCRGEVGLISADLGRSVDNVAIACGPTSRLALFVSASLIF
jgi:hypothetical protein